MHKLETGSYKGVRDFYPEDQYVQNHIFQTWRKVAESFGYVEYGASILEPAELYKAKTGEEIVSEQTYTFTDRGEREVTLRPEMTPTTARMVAARKRELAFPLRWYSVPNLFRYEAPQKGRLREHWQWNVDLFGVKGLEAEAEVIELAYRAMKSFGAEDGDFLIRINSRRIIDRLFSLFGVSEGNAHKLSKLMDKRAKISEEEFSSGAEKLLGDEYDRFLELIGSPDKLFDKLGRDSEEVQEIMRLSEMLAALEITNLTFDLTLMRGFDYYTGIIFEIFDTDPSNNRSLFGGGRYDELLDIFGEETVPAFGFGAGDVTMRDFLETRGLLPEYKPSAIVAILTLDTKNFSHASLLANGLRSAGINACIDATERKLGDKIKAADKQHIRYIIAVGDEEEESKTYKLKNLESGEETLGSVDSLALEFKKE